MCCVLGYNDKDDGATYTSFELGERLLLYTGSFFSGFQLVLSSEELGGPLEGSAQGFSTG